MPSDKDESQVTKKKFFCPNCKSENVSMRNIQTKGGRKVVLAKPARAYFEDLFDEEEFVGLACKDCGFVFFMLKGYV